MPNRRLPGTDFRLVNLGVDLGGTNLRWVLTTSAGRAVKTFQGPAVPPNQLPGRLRNSLPPLGRKSIQHLIIGSKGVWALPERRALQRRCRGLAQRVTVLSDVELAFWTSVGRRTESGLYLAVGTGSLALGRTPAGRWVRAGGLGPRLGDEGSGFWIGREYLRRVKGKSASDLRRLSSTPEAVRQTAALARRVAFGAPTDSRYRSILRDAQEQLVRLVEEAARPWGNRRGLRLGGGGAVYENADFRSGFWRRLRQKWPGRFIPAAPARDVARRAARDAERLAQRAPRSVPPRRLAKK